MIFSGITCTVYGKVKTRISEEMRLVEASNGEPMWYDFGAIYDNLTIECTITSGVDDKEELESIVRQQSKVDAITVAFSGGEWLYDYTGDFTIQKYDVIDRVDGDNSEWGFKVTLSPATPVLLSTLPGDRTECTGSGYMTYDGVSIPQPKKFDYKYQTVKYTGLTHGSSYSAEMPTNGRDTTAFTPIMNSGNMRALVDKITTTRGEAFFVNFPAKCFAFGMVRGADAQNLICKHSKKEYTITNENGDWYIIDLGLYAVEGVLYDDTPPVSFYEAGIRAEFPYSGASGAPVSYDPRWGAVSFSPAHVISFSGEKAAMANTGGGNYMYSVDVGTVETATQTLTFSGYTGSVDQYWGIISDGTAANRYGVHYKSSTSQLYLYNVNNGTLTIGPVLGVISTPPKTAVFSIVVNGADVEYDISATNQSDASFNFAGTDVGAYNTNALYGLYQSSNFNITTIEECRVTGSDYPYSE